MIGDQDAPTATASTPVDIAAVVLAAGKSTRMRSKLPKTLHPICGRPLIIHILQALSDAGVTRRVVVVGHQAELVRETIDGHFGVGAIEYVEQTEQRGTGHAVLMAEPLLQNHTGPTLIVPGDAPLLTGEVLSRLISLHSERSAAVTLLTAILPHHAGTYGRVVRDDQGHVLGIVEARDASPKQLALREINTSIYVFNTPSLFRALARITPDNAQAELYLTDSIAVLRTNDEKVVALVSPDPDVVLGVNTRVELVEVAARMRARILKEIMLSGVTVVDPATTFVDAGVSVGQDTVLHPFTILTGQTVIGEDCVIGPNAQIHESRLADGVQARVCVMDRVVVGENCRIGPFTHLRPGSELKSGVKLGNFVEVKNARLHEGVAAGHLTYLGDAEVGERTNIGAGTITCNYDGYDKHRTAIGANAFIGSATVLVAPVNVADGVVTGAGSVITRDVPEDALAIAREPQTNKEGWAERRRRAFAARRKEEKP
ncbi:MAG: bifunctional UDP-N-acetylglucosamine diphosphorylase/glucosamine-1-phosphate N-acetyltransferase GlmU [Capsulimonadales bacterium]|nr:bifunctional UDP-N-acetylglucosamine diphosphorylase/glucosamine-1-phosphate N-acetyltransferase GlmU [Capsulimonadales bacterium]